MVIYYNNTICIIKIGYYSIITDVIFLMVITNSIKVRKYNKKRSLPNYGKLRFN